MEIYHYSHPGRLLRGEEGRVILPPHSIKGDEFGVYALLKPTPVNWVNNPYFSGPFKGIWDRFQQKVGVILMGIRVNPTDSAVSVYDYGHIAGGEYVERIKAIKFPAPGYYNNYTSEELDKYLNLLPERYRHPNERIATEMYRTSKVSLSKFISYSQDFNYALPEIFVARELAPQEVRFARVQPFLEQYMRLTGDTKKWLHYWIVFRN